MKILLVEDDPTLGEAVMLAVRQAGFAVDWSRDGVQAETALKTYAYDAMLLDLGLPRREGLEVLRNARTRGATLPVMVLTARDTVEDRVRGLAAGAGRGRYPDSRGPLLFRQREAAGQRRRDAVGVGRSRGGGARNSAEPCRACDGQGGDRGSSDGMG